MLFHLKIYIENIFQREECFFFPSSGRNQAASDRWGKNRGIVSDIAFPLPVNGAEIMEIRDTVIHNIRDRLLLVKTFY